MSVRRTRARSTALIAASLGFALLTAACSGSSSPSETGGLAASDTPTSSSSGGNSTITIGLLSTLDGPFAVLGEAANRGAKLALLEAGGTLDGTGPRDGVSGVTIGGKEVKLVIGSSDATPDKAVEATRMAWGLCTVAGVAGKGETLDIVPRLLITGRRVAGSSFGGVKGRDQVPELVDRWMAGDIDIDPFISHELSLEEVNRGFDLMEAQDGIRSVIRF